MTLEDLRKRVREWDLQNMAGVAVADSKYSYLLAQLEHYAARDWKFYLPAEHPDFNSSYLNRLAGWIGNLHSEDDQKLLLEYALCISFFSHDDFSALYRTAFNREVMRWIASQVGAVLKRGKAAEFAETIRWHAHHQTWFCPVTDSMDINEFYKVNHLTGSGHRPCFATLQRFAEESGPINQVLSQNVAHYMQCPGDPSHPPPPLERLVLIEDMVGSGSQCMNAVRWAVQNVSKPILFVPLILCPNGVSALDDEVQRSNGRLTVCPIVELQRGDLLGPERHGNTGWPITASMEALAINCSAVALPGLDPFGYKSTGCSLATFSNTPDNTLPIVHHKPANGSWEPLFPRVFRD